MQNAQFRQNGNGSATIIEIANTIFRNMGVEGRIDSARIFCEAEPYLSIIESIFPESIDELTEIDQDTNLDNGQKIQTVIHLLESLIDKDLSHISGTEIARGKQSHIISLLQLLQILSSDGLAQASNSSVQSALSSKAAQSQQKRESHKAVMQVHKQSQVNKNGKEDKVSRQKQSDRKGKSRAELESNSESDFPIKPIQAYKKYQQVKSKGSNGIKRSQNPRSPAKAKEIDLASTASSHALSNQLGLHYKKQNKQMISLIQQLLKAQQNLQIERGDKLQSLFAQEQRELQRQRYRSARKIEGEANKRKQFIQRKMDDRSKMLQSLQSGQHFTKSIRSIFKQEGKVKREEKQRQKRQQQKQAKELLDFGVFDELMQKALESNSLKSSSHRHK